MKVKDKRVYIEDGKYNKYKYKYKYKYNKHKYNKYK